MPRALLLACLAISAATGQVRVWEGSIQLPTYAEGDPDPIPQFAAFTTDQPANYPYPYRSQIRETARNRSIIAWRTLNIENEYLSCRVLPDLGGHIYNCRDKLADREVFYVAQVIKKAIIGSRGAWISTGVEPNFPVAHSRTTVSPFAFALRSEAGGAASIIVSDTDRVTGMQSRIEYRLSPGAAVLEQYVTLYNPTPVRKPYLWWNNAEIEWDDPGIRYIIPAHVVTSHGQASIETWPVNSAGVDLSVAGNYPTQDGWFAYHSHEPFMAVYKPKFRLGVAHVADPAEIAGKKAWVMGRDGIELYSRELTDGGNMFVEMQAGMFADQETNQFLAPEESRTFAEYWIPFRDMSGLTRATADLALYAARTGAGSSSVSIELSPARSFPGAKIRLLSGAKLAWETTTDLVPGKTWKSSQEIDAGQPFTVQVLDAAGKTLLQHREGAYDAATPEGLTTGPQKPVDQNVEASEELLLRRGDQREKISQPLLALSDYAIGMQRFPKNREFEKAAARLALSLGKYEEAASRLERILAASGAPPSTDYETLYYAGVAESWCGRDDQAIKFLSQVAAASSFGAAASLELAFIAARDGTYSWALKLLERLADDQGKSARIAGIRVALLRRANPMSVLPEVKKALKAAPDDPLLRYEGTLAGIPDPALWSYLAGDAERVLNLADEYMRLALWEEASSVLAHDYGTENPHYLEPGSVAPQDSAIAAYYLAFCKMALKIDATPDLKRASALGTRYQFPSRVSSYAVLRAAVKHNPSDATAHALLGNLDLFSLRLDEAAAEWGKAVALNPKLEIERQDLTRTSALIKTNPNLVSALPSLPSDRKTPSAAPASRPGTTKAVAPVTRPAPAPSPDRIFGQTPEDLAAAAMIKAAAGSGSAAAAVFRTPPFQSDKQTDGVRQAYIEVQLQILIGLSASGKCDAISERVERLGLDDVDIPFTLYGFGKFVRLPHFQYYSGVIEANCGHTKEASKYWAKIAKTKESPSTPEYAYPFLAAARLNSAAKSAASAAAKALQAGGDTASDLQALHRALLLRAGGDEAEALPQLTSLARLAKDPMVLYLATVEVGQTFP